jgi:PAT family beta-lactamase induction signal transducer AmpG
MNSELNTAEVKDIETFEKNNLILSENPVLRYLTFSVLYFAQGIPQGITLAAIPAWMAMNHKTPAEIGSFIAVMGIPWSIKILIAPIMDRYTILSMGRKRPWVIFGQLGLIISFYAIGFVPDPLNNLKWLMIVGFFINFFGAFQDVATDGMAIDVVPINEQARTNGLMWGSVTIGYSLSMLVGTVLINTLGFSSAIPFLAVAVGFIILAPIMFRERSGEKIMPWTKGEISENSKNEQSKSWVAILKDLLKVVILPASLLIIITCFYKGFLNNLVYTSFTIFTIQDLGWTNTSFSQIASISDVVAGILGMFAGGYLVDRFGEKRMLTIYFSVFTLLLLSIGFFENYWANDTLIFIFYSLYTLLATFITISILAGAMKLCWKTVAATQFTLYMAINNMGQSIGAGIVGPLKEHISWATLFLLMAIPTLLIIVIIQFLNFSKHLKTIEKF